METTPFRSFPARFKPPTCRRRRGGEDVKAHGNIVDHEYEIEQDGHEVGEVSKKWFRLRDTYGVEVKHGADPVLILAITVAIDGMTRDGA